MSLASLARLIALSAIWGASFLFTRIGAPVLGAPWLTVGRVGLGALFLLAVGLALRKPLDLRVHWRHFVVVGLFNSALPFLLYGVAAQTLSASLLSILNATAPIWSAAIGVVWSRSAPTWKSAAGLALGIAGVGVLAGFDPSLLHRGAGIALLVALGAPLCYGIATHYARSAPRVDAFANAHGGMWAATAMLVPIALGSSAPGGSAITPGVAAAVLALGVLCTGVAFLLYFRLVEDVGPTSALTVTFLIPVFGVLWGHLFLDEPVGVATFVGACTVFVGTALVTGFSLAALRPAATPRR